MMTLHDPLTHYVTANCVGVGSVFGKTSALSIATAKTVE